MALTDYGGPSEQTMPRPPPQLSAMTREQADAFVAYDQRRAAEQWTNTAPAAAPPGRALEPWQTEDRIAYNEARKTADALKRQQFVDARNRAASFAQHRFGVNPLNILPQAQRVANAGEQYTAMQDARANPPMGEATGLLARNDAAGLALYNRASASGATQQDMELYQWHLETTRGMGEGKVGPLEAWRAPIPYADRVANAAGAAGRFVGEGVGRAVGNALYSPPSGDGLGDTGARVGGKIGEEIGQGLVPTEVWQLALELAPGIGSVPGVASALRTEIPALRLAAKQAGMRFEEYMAGRAGREALTALLEKRGIKMIAGGSQTPEELAAKAAAGAGEAAGGLPASAADNLPLPTKSLSRSDTAILDERIPEDPLRRVEGEMLPPAPETGLAKPGKVRLLPYQTSMEKEITVQVASETPGTKLAKGIRAAGGKRLIDVINPSALNDPKNDLLSIITTGYRRAVNQGLETNKVGMAYLTDKALPFELGKEGVVTNLPLGSRFGPKATQALVPPGMTTGGFEGEHVIDILERATRADVGKNLTPDQWTWTVTARQIIDDAMDDLFKAHGTVRGTPAADTVLRELGFGQGEHYFPRRVIGRNGIEAARMTGAGARPGSAKFFEKTRVNEYVAQGVADGLDFDNPINTMNTFLGAIRRETADAELIALGKRLGVSREAAGVGEDAYVGAMSGAVFGRTGTIPVRESQLPGLRGWLFPADVINTVEKHLLDAGNEWTRSISRVSAPLRFSVAGFDIGTPLINGLPVLFRNPVAWGRAVVGQFKALANPRFLSEYMINPENRALMQEFLDAGNQLMEPEFLQSLRPGGLLQKAETLPVVGTGVARLEAGRDAFITVGQFEMWKGLRGAARNDVDRAMLAGINNDLMGVTNLPRTGIGQTQMDAENAILWFAGRFTKAPVALTGHLLGSRIGAQEAVRSLATFAGGGALVMYGLAKKQGMSDDEIRTMFDPTSGGRFLSVRVRGNWIGIGGAYRSLAQLVAKSYTAVKDDPAAFLANDSQRNPLLYYWRSRAAPLTGTAWSIATQRDFIGQPINSPSRVLQTVTRMLTPAAIDAFIHGGNGLIDKSIGAATTALGPRVNPLTPGDHVAVAAEEGARAAGYASFNDMRAKLGTSAAYAALEDSSPDFAELRRKAAEAGQIRREDRGIMSLTDALQPFREEQGAADINPDLQDPQKWIEDRKARRQREAGGIAIWEKDNPDQVAHLSAYSGDPFNLGENIKPDDLTAAYFKVFKMHQTATGGTDDTQALSDDLDRFTAQLTPEQQHILDTNTGVHATEREVAYRAATNTLADGGYFDRRDEAFAAWLTGLKASAATPASVKALAETWTSPNDLALYAQDLERQHGNATEKYTTLPIWNGWETFTGRRNQQFLATHPEIDVLAIEWGYQTRVHSAAAARLYTERTGLRAPVPSN